MHNKSLCDCLRSGPYTLCIDMSSIRTIFTACRSVRFCGRSERSLIYFLESHKRGERYHFAFFVEIGSRRHLYPGAEKIFNRDCYEVIWTGDIIYDRFEMLWLCSSLSLEIDFHDELLEACQMRGSSEVNSPWICHILLSTACSHCIGDFEKD
jgi:hypothetical protein